MSKMVYSKSQLVAGVTAYVITTSDTIEAVRVIRRKGDGFAFQVEGTVPSAPLIGFYANNAHNFRTRNKAKRYAQLRGITIEG